MESLLYKFPKDILFKIICDREKILELSDDINRTILLKLISKYDLRIKNCYFCLSKHNVDNIVVKCINNNCLNKVCEDCKLAYLCPDCFKTKKCIKCNKNSPIRHCDECNKLICEECSTKVEWYGNEPNENPNYFYLCNSDIHILECKECKHINTDIPIRFCDCELSPVIICVNCCPVNKDFHRDCL